MNVIRTTAFIAAAAAIAVAAGTAFGANPVYYAPYSPAPTYVASPYGYATYCTQNGCYQVPVSNPGVQTYGYPASAYPANGYPTSGYPAGSPCANGACAISPSYGTPRSTPVNQTMPAPAYRTAPTAPSNYQFNSGSGGYYTVPSNSPAYTAPQTSPFYGSPGATNPAGGTKTGSKVSAPVLKAPSRNIALNDMPSPFYP